MWFLVVSLIVSTLFLFCFFYKPRLGFFGSPKISPRFVVLTNQHLYAIAAIEKKVDDIVEDSVEFADQSPMPEPSQLLENVFPDPKGFGIDWDGKYRFEDPKFSQGTADV